MTHKPSLLIPVLLLTCFAAAAQTIWTGNANTNWNNAGNWTAGIPDAADDVIIPNVANDPVIFGGTAAVAKSVSIGNDGSLVVNAMASLSINGAANTGLTNQGTVNNDGTIRIGNTSSVGTYRLLNNAIFNNDAGGEISIDRSTGPGLYNFGGIFNAGTFTNAAKITIGAVAIMTTYGLKNEATFSSQSCAFLIVFAPVFNSNAFTNDGLFYVNTPSAHSNTGLTNHGILTYPNGNPIPNVTNNDFIMVPISGAGAIPNALQKGTAPSFTVGNTWYLDPQLTQPGGTYNPAANTFTPVGGTGIRYFSITDNVNGCSRRVAIMVTVTGGGNPPAISCPANIVNSTDAGQCSAVVTYATPTAACNCSPAPVVTHLSGGLSGSSFQKGATAVTWMAADASNNTAT